MGGRDSHFGSMHTSSFFCCTDCPFMQFQLHHLHSVVAGAHQPHTKFRLRLRHNCCITETPEPPKAQPKDLCFLGCSELIVEATFMPERNVGSILQYFHLSLSACFCA